MPVDGSVYSNFQPADIGEAIQRGLTLKQLGMQNQQIKQQMQNEQAMRDAYAKNTNPDGTLNQQSFLSDIGKASPQAAIQMQKQFSEMAKQQAETSSAQTKAAQDRLSAIMPHMQYINSLPENQKPAAYAQSLATLSHQGIIDPSLVPAQYDPDKFKQMYGTLTNTKDYVDQQNTRATTAHTQSETAMQPVVQANKIADTKEKLARVGEIGDKQLQALKEDLDPNKARGGNMAKNQSVVNAADRLNAMFQQFPDYNIPKAQQAELVSAFGSMLNGGSAPFVSQLEELVPKSAAGDANAIASWVLSQPMGADQQKFMQLLHDSVNREREVAQNQVKDAQVQRLAAHELIKKNNPEGYANVLNGFGISPEEIQNGKYVPIGSTGGANSEKMASVGKMLGGKKTDDGNAYASAPKAPQITANDMNALGWLNDPKTDKTSPEYFAIKSKLKGLGLVK